MSILDNEGHDPNGLFNRPRREVDHESIASHFERELISARAEIERLKGEVVKWQIEAGKFGAGCPACDDIEEENERLRAALRKIADYDGEVHTAGWKLHNIACVALDDVTEQYGQEP